MGNNKGRRRERQAAELYEKAGYETFRPQESKFGETDMFGLFDVLAVGDHDVILSQVKSNRAAGVREWTNETVHRFGAAPVRLHFLVAHDNEGWRLLVPHGPTQKTTIVDERDMDVNMGEGIVEYLRGSTGGDG